ncbi:hypothetical protein DH2020_010537 [Rehmannia glutinosa]|uniref:RRM domain-containing protein n=1 Tax=Rehmannia glutinosa TaxID=99300 RepID=A0ABR0XAV9_REHGL
MDKISKRSKGYAFVEYTTEEAASTALREMNGKKIGVTGIEPVGCLPRNTASASYGNCNAGLNNFSQSHNQVLKQSIGALNNEATENNIYFCIYHVMLASARFMVSMDSSAERVESIDDILMEILIRLPEKSIFRFMSVSKRWTNIITNPFFLKTLSRRRCRGGGRLLALIERNFFPVPWFKPLPRWPPPMNILPVIDDDHRTSICKYVPKLLGYFINSSNGLILCGRHPYQYHVLNPVSRKWVMLPPPSPVALDGYERKSVGLMCEENTSELVADYTVVIAAAHADDNTMRIESYSSKTGKWVVKKLAADSLGLLKLCQPPEVANGIFHWKSALHFGVIGVYDPRLDENHVQLLELPKDVVMNENFVSRTITRSPVDDALWYGFITRDNLQFFRLNGYNRSSGYSSTTTIPGTEWVLMHSVSIDWLRKEAGVPPGVQVERKDPRKTKKNFSGIFHSVESTSCCA